MLHFDEHIVAGVFISLAQKNKYAVRYSGFTNFQNDSPFGKTLRHIQLFACTVYTRKHQPLHILCFGSLIAENSADKICNKERSYTK